MSRSQISVTGIMIILQYGGLFKPIGSQVGGGHSTFYQPDGLQSGSPPAQSQSYNYMWQCFLLSFQPSPPYHWQDLSGQGTLHWRENTTMRDEYKKIQALKTLKRPVSVHVFGSISFDQECFAHRLDHE